MTRIVSFVCVLLWCVVVRADMGESGSYQRVEQVGEKTFAVKVVFDGVDVATEFLIDGHAVDKVTYQQQKIDADEQDMASLAQRLQKTHADFESFIDQVRTKASLKLLVYMRDACKKVLKSLHDHVEEAYFMFDPTTISSLRFLQVIEHDMLPVFAFCDDERLQHESPIVLKQCVNVIISLYEHLAAFYKASVQCALEHADNPKSLQELLDLM